MVSPFDTTPDHARGGRFDAFRRAVMPRLSPRIYSLLRRALLIFAALPYAVQSGQLRSAVTGKVVDRHGSPVPWLTYPAIHFLSSLSYDGKQILEFGSGYSTLWWAERAESVTSFEADRSWLENIRGKLTSNAAVIALPTDPDDPYHGTVELDAFLAEQLGDQRFDVIVIDGVDRVGTARASLAYLADNGFVIADNSDGWMLPDGTMPILDVFRDAGMQRVDFYGLGPSVLFAQCTSIAFRGSSFAFDGRQNTSWLKPFARKSYGNVGLNTEFTAADGTGP